VEQIINKLSIHRNVKGGKRQNKKKSGKDEQQPGLMNGKE